MKPFLYTWSLYLFMQTKNFNSRMSFKNSIYHSVKKMVGLIPKNKDANFLQYSKIAHYTKPF